LFFIFGKIEILRMKNALLKLAEKCFFDARMTDELCSASVKKYQGSIKRFAAVVRAKNWKI